jgi:hypothetical protein
MFLKRLLLAFNYKICYQIVNLLPGSNLPSAYLDLGNLLPTTKSVFTPG